MAPKTTRRWILANPPSKEVITSGDDVTFKLETADLSEPGPNQVLVKVLYLSNDPAQRSWIQRDADPERLYVAPVYKGEVMRSIGIGEVITSNSDDLKPGTLVSCYPNWSEYAVLEASACRPIQPDEKAGIRATHFVGALGGPGLTSYYGLIDIAGAKEGESIVVSGAAGATGSMVVQVAKHIVGAKRVIGIAGGEKKCRWVESLGADICVDYKSPTFEADLIKATEGFVDVYFDNVGGHILDLMLKRVKRHGRVAVCGAISTYNNPGSQKMQNWTEVILNRIRIEGFIVLDAFASGRAGEMLAKIIETVKEGKIKIGTETETVVPTKFEDIPKTWLKLFEGGNQGKLITELQV